MRRQLFASSLTPGPASVVNLKDAFTDLSKSIEAEHAMTSVEFCRCSQIDVRRAFSTGSP